MGETEEIYRRLNRLETTLAEVRTDLKNLHDDVAELLRVVVRGNGDSLVTRLRIVERDVGGHASHIAQCKLGGTELAREGVRGKWAAVAALIGAGGGLAGAALAYLLHGIGTRGAP